MTCTRVKVGDIEAIVCMRGRKPRALCTACKERPHTRLCDYPLAGRKAGATCSVRLCDRCAVRIDHDVDYCPPHARVDRGESAVEAPAPPEQSVSEFRREVLRAWTTVADSIEARVRAWCAERFVDEGDVIEFWNERAAIREHDGGAARSIAEELAFADVRGRFGP